MKKGFSLLVAIFTIILLSLVASYIFYLTSTVTKVGNLQYKKEQAMLLARSYTEYAILAIQGHDRNTTGNCLEEIKANIGDSLNGNGFNVLVKINYIGNEKYVNMCTNVIAKLDDNNSEDTLSALIDVYVRYKESFYLDKTVAPWVTYHKRSLQKI